MEALRHGEGHIQIGFLAKHAKRAEVKTKTHVPSLFTLREGQGFLGLYLFHVRMISPLEVGACP